MEIIPEADYARIEVFKRYHILGTPPENAFNNVAELAAKIFPVPISLVSRVDKDRVYFKANYGMGQVTQSAREISLCSLSILDDGLTVFENVLEERCLLTNPNVAGSFGLKFYAATPLITSDGFRIGTLCIIGKTPRKFSPSDREVLQGLAKVVMDEIELRRSAISESEKQRSNLKSMEVHNQVLEHSYENLQESQHHTELINEELIAATKTSALQMQNLHRLIRN